MCTKVSTDSLSKTMRMINITLKKCTFRNSCIFEMLSFKSPKIPIMKISKTPKPPSLVSLILRGKRGKIC